MSAHFVLATARKDFRRRLADPAALLIWLALPLAIGSLLVLINSGDGGTPRGRLLVVDEDRSFVSALIAGIPTRGEMAELFDVVHVERDEGHRLIDTGEATALVILPAGLQGAFMGNGNAEIQLLTNPSHRILPSIIEETLEIAVDSAVYTERLTADVALRFTDFRLDGSSASSTSPDMRLADLIQRVGLRLRELGKKVLAPPVLTAEFTPAPDADPTGGESAVPDVGKVFLPSMIFLSVLFIAQGMSGEVWNEKRCGTLHRAASSPPSMGRLSRRQAARGDVDCRARGGGRSGRGHRALRPFPGPGAAGGALGRVLRLRDADLLRSSAVLRFEPAGGRHAFQHRPLSGADAGGLLLSPGDDARLDGGDRPLDAERRRPGPSRRDPRRTAEFPRDGGGGPVDRHSCGHRICPGDPAPLRSLPGVLTMWRDARFIAGRDLAIMLRTRETILWTFVMPVVFFYFMGTVTADFGGRDPSAPDPIALRGAGGEGFLVAEITRRLEEQHFAVHHATSPAGLRPPFAAPDPPPAPCRPCEPERVDTGRTPRGPRLRT